ncbi:TPA: ADP-ribose diphosphatase [Vibrio parahaemolyticus]|nr:ADP-ribose diphosphatase [Vibrio parahaemolyticus]
MQQCDKRQDEFTSRDVEIISKESVFEGFFKMVKYRFKHKLFAGGWSDVVEREMFERGHAAAMLPYDPKTDQVVIIEQIRIGALEHEHPWQLEIVAGMIDRDESAEEVIRREAEEEAGITVGRVASVTSYYPSSGGCSEKLDVFVGEVDASKAHGIHGLDYEDEDIRVHVLSREQAYQWVKDGIFENGASIIALQWLQLNHQELRSQWGSPQIQIVESK